MKQSFRIAAVVVLVFAFSSVIMAQSDPRMGTWKLNVSKSKFDPGPADMIAVKRVDSNTQTATATKAGKVVQTGRNVVSKDGKVGTFTAKGTIPSGQPYSVVVVWDKQ